MINQSFPFGTKEYQTIRQMCYQRLQAGDRLNHLEDLIQDVATAIYEKVKAQTNLQFTYTQNKAIFKTEVSRTIFALSKKMFGEENELKSHLYSKIMKILKEQEDIELQGKYCFWFQEEPCEHISHIQAHWKAQNKNQLPPIIQSNDSNIIKAISFYMKDKEMVEVWNICNFIWKILSPAWGQLFQNDESVGPNFVLYLKGREISLQVTEEEYWLLVSYGVKVASGILERYESTHQIQLWLPPEIQQAQVLFDCFQQTLKNPARYQKKNGSWNITQLAEVCNSTSPTMKKILGFMFQDIRNQIELHFPRDFVSTKTQMAVMELLIQLHRREG